MIGSSRNSSVLTNTEVVSVGIGIIHDDLVEIQFKGKISTLTWGNRFDGSLA